MAEFGSGILQDEALRGEVRKYPELYDPRMKSYKNVIKKAAAWTAISSTVNHTAEECKHRWKAIRDKFVRERKKLGKKKSGDGATIVHVWPLMGILMFLADTIAHRISVGNMSTSEDSSSVESVVRSASPILTELANGGASPISEDESQNILDELDSQEDGHHDRLDQRPSENDAPQVPAPVAETSRGDNSQESPAVASPSSCAPGKRRKRMDPTEKYLLTVIKSSADQMKVSSAPIDEDDHFWYNLKPSIKNLPQEKKSLLKIKMMDLVHSFMYQ